MLAYLGFFIFHLPDSPDSSVWRIKACLLKFWEQKEHVTKLPHFHHGTHTLYPSVQDSLLPSAEFALRIFCWPEGGVAAQQHEVGEESQGADGRGTTPVVLWSNEHLKSSKLVRGGGEPDWLWVDKTSTRTKVLVVFAFTFKAQ